MPRGSRAALLAVSILTGCSVPIGAPLRHKARIEEHEVHCARATMGQTSPYRMPLAAPLDDPERAKWLDVLPTEARRTARAAGLEPLLASLLEALHAPRATDNLLHALQRRQDLTLQLVAFDAQLSALAFETSCTRRRVATLISALDEREGGRQLALATSSLVFGASTGMAAGAWGLADSRSNMPTIVGIAGGVLTAGLGAASLLVPERAVILEHRHNLLRPVFEGADPAHLYPSFVFRMLTSSYARDDAVPRTAMLADFDQTLRRHLPSRDHEHAREVLFGDSGVYPRALLETRADMLLVLESAVQGVARELELLDRALVRVTAFPVR